MAGIPPGTSAVLAQQQGLPLGMIPPPPPPPPTALQVQTSDHVAHTGLAYRLSTKLGIATCVVAVLFALGYVLTKPAAANGQQVTGRVTGAQTTANPGRKYVWLLLAVSAATGGAGFMALKKGQ